MKREPVGRDKALKDRRDQIKQLRKERDVIKAEKADMYRKAVDVNDKIAEVRKKLADKYNKRRAMTKEIEKRIAERREVSRTIDIDRQEINTLKSTKRTMFDACRSKKSAIVEKETLIIKAQNDIDNIKGTHKSW
jgi:chromosome segregation ATPase